MKSVDDAVNCIKSQIPHCTGSVGIITGSGWNLKNLLNKVTEIEYKDITGFPIPSVGGHRGRLIHGYHDGIEVLLLQGRAHYYEGYSMEEVTFPVRVLPALGIRQVVITNAAGGIRPDFRPGDFMVVTDHINLMGVNPLRATVNTLPFKGRDRACPELVSGVGMGFSSESISKENFVDMTEAYDKESISMLVHSGKQLGIMLHTGILAAVAGPSYETPAEIRMLSVLGADAVCMSTVPEVIMSRYLGMKVLAVSMITNHAAGISISALRHEDVVSMAESRSKDASLILSAVIHKMPR